MPTFDLELLGEAKLCSSGCKYDDGEGQVLEMTKDYSVYCVGCGRACHMPCHKVPMSMSSVVKRVPKENRMNAYFGECSYLRIVCDNCANLLITDVPRGSKSCFLTLFNQLAKKNNDKNDTNATDSDVSRAPATQRSKKRKADEAVGDKNEIVLDMKCLLEKCLDKMSNFEIVSSQLQSTVARNDDQLDKLYKLNIDTSKQLTKKLDDIGVGVNNMGTKCDSNGQLLNDINTKLEHNVISIDDGLQKGFNKLVDLTEKLYSPATPRSANNYFMASGRSSVRKTAISNDRARRNFTHGTPTGPSLPTQSGAATDEGLFGPAVPRKLNFGEPQTLNRGPRKEFRHDNAIYIRYVDPSITSDKMMAILTKNEAIKNALDHDPNAVEITRLVKNGCTEEEIAKRRYGVSYRIGCSLDLLSLVNDKSIWASHWEIRLWDKEFGKEQRGEHRDDSANFHRQAENQHVHQS